MQRLKFGEKTNIVFLLQPILRRVWTPKGEQPIAQVKTKYQWVWLYGFVHPESGENKGVDTA